MLRFRSCSRVFSGLGPALKAPLPSLPCRHVSRVSMYVADVEDAVRFWSEALHLKRAGLAADVASTGRALLGPSAGCRVEVIADEEASRAPLSPILTVAVSNLPTTVRDVARKGGSGVTPSCTLDRGIPEFVATDPSQRMLSVLHSFRRRPLALVTLLCRSVAVSAEFYTSIAGMAVVSDPAEFDALPLPAPLIADLRATAAAGSLTGPVMLRNPFDAAATDLLLLPTERAAAAFGLTNDEFESSVEKLHAAAAAGAGPDAAAAAPQKPPSLPDRERYAAAVTAALLDRFGCSADRSLVGFHTASKRLDELDEEEHGRAGVLLRFDVADVRQAFAVAQSRQAAAEEELEPFKTPEDAADSGATAEKKSFTAFDPDGHVVIVVGEAQGA